MRKINQLLLLLLALPLCTGAQTFQEIVQQHPWTCITTIPSTTHVGSDSMIQQLYAIQFDSTGNNYSGMAVTLYRGGGMISQAKCRITGKLIISNDYISITRMKGNAMVREEMPKAWLTYSEGEITANGANLDWTREHGALYIMQDEGRPGQFYLEGRLAGNSP